MRFLLTTLFALGFLVSGFYLFVILFAMTNKPSDVGFGLLVLGLIVACPAFGIGSLYQLVRGFIEHVEKDEMRLKAEKETKKALQASYHE